MKFKKEYLVLAVIILGLVLYLYLRKTERTLYDLPALPQVSAKEISKIEIEKADGKIVLKKKGDSWFLAPQDWPADPQRVKGINDTLAGLSLTAMVSESKNYDRYGLSQDKKISVRAWVGDTLQREFEIGNDVASSRHTFVRLAGDDRIYHAQDNFRNKFNRPQGEFRDKTVLSFVGNDIQEIELIKGDNALVFKRSQLPLEKEAAGDEGQSALKGEMIWQATDGRKGDETRLNRLLSALANLSCEDYIDDRKKEDFNNPIYSIRLTGDREYSLKIFPKLKEDDDRYPAVSSENNYPFLLPEWKAEDVMPETTELFQNSKES